MNPDQTSDTYLLAPLPSPAALLHRTQTSLGLLREVVQESSTSHWYKQGKLHNDNHNWEAAIYILNKCMHDKQSYFFLKAHIQLVFALVQQNNIHLAARLLSEEYRLYTFVGDIKYTNICNELTSFQWHAIKVSLLFYSSLSSKSIDSLWALVAFYAAQSECDNLRKTLDTIFSEHRISIEHSAEWFDYSGDCWRWHSDGKQQLKALADYNRAIELEPTKSWRLVSIGHIKVDLDDYEGAVYSFAQALRAGVDVMKSLEQYVRSAKFLRNKTKVEVYSSLIQQLKSVTN